MGEACCVGERNSERGTRNAELPWRVARGTRLALVFPVPRSAFRVWRFRVPPSAFRVLHRMKFPDRLAIPPEALKIAQTLEDAAYQTCCVGGAIRANLLGLENR